MLTKILKKISINIFKLIFVFNIFSYDSKTQQISNDTCKFLYY